MVASPEPVCQVCGGPREPQKQAACSDRCRAALSRRRKAEAQRTRDAETLAGGDGIERLCGLLKARLQTS